MNFKRFIIISFSIFLDVVSPQGSETLTQSQVKEKVYKTFQSIYFHLGYTSYFLAKRSNQISNTQPHLFDQNDQMRSKSNKILKLLGFDPKIEFPNVTTSVILNQDSFPLDTKDFEDLAKVESHVKDSLKIIQESFVMWSKYFENTSGLFQPDHSRLQNDNVYRLVFNDLILIFFDVANDIIETYQIKLNKAKPEEIYVKAIYTKGLMYYQENLMYSGVEGESAVGLLSRRSRDPNLDLLNRMFSDIESSLKPSTPEIEMLIKLFKSYKETFESL